MPNMSEKNLGKILAIILATASLTACGGGGGGGGGGGSAPSTPSIPNLPQVAIPNVNDVNSRYEIGKTKGDKVVGIYGKNINHSGNLEITDTNLGKILGNNSLDGYSFGLFSENGEVSNIGTINLKGDSLVGIYGNNSSIINNGIIKSENSNNVIGIFSNGKNGIARNNGKIDLIGNRKAIGMYLYNSVGVNNKDIEVSSNGKAIGIYAIGQNATGINNGKIVVKGNGVGMVAGYGGQVKNLGEITVQNRGYGMYAFKGGYALNDKSGVINLSSQANGAMVADGAGSIVENRGVINIDKDNSIISKGNEIQSINGGKVINTGTINRDGDLYISANSGVYQIGTSQDGEYGKIKGTNLKVDGNIEIGSDITKNGYRDSYLLEDVFQGENISFGENTTVKSNSLLYDANIKENSSGNIDGELVRNDKELTDFVDKNLESTAEIFTKYYDEGLYTSLDSASKNIINGINLENSSALSKDLERLTPRVYENIQREVLDISSLFRENREKSIKNMGAEDCYISLIESGWKVDSKNSNVGYENLTSGFLGSKAIGQDTYLSFGYGYSDIDYTNDDSSKIHSLQLGVDKLIKNSDFTISLGISGNYNYHKNERDNDTINSKFNSYGINSYGKISKTFDGIVNVTPFGEINLDYYNIESFDENIDNFVIEVEKQNIFSVKPKVGMELEKKIKDVNLYSQVAYSYELGDIDKNLDYTYKNINEKNSLDRDDKREVLDLKVGVNYSREKVWLNASLGKSFERRDNRYLEFSFGYKF